MRPLVEEVSVRFAASPAAIWALLSDITQMGRWSPECTGATWVGEASSPLPGNRFRGTNRVGPLRWSTTCTIVAAEPGRLLVFDACHWSGATTRWTFELSPDDRGTIVRESFRTIDSPALIIILDRLARRPRRLGAGMRTTLERLSAQAERMPPPRS
ncbi:SRPBCC family protein [Mycolicibacterium sp. XJ2546]